MKEFIRKICIIIILIFMLILMMNYFYKRIDISDNDNVGKFKTIPNEIEISNLGSSHGLFGFCYDDVNSYQCFNFALTSQSFYYDYKLLQQYESNLKNGGIIFIPISYFSFYGIDETEQKDFQSKNKRYYQILEPKYIKDFSIENLIILKYFPILDSDVAIQKIINKSTASELEDFWNVESTGINIESDADAAYKRHILINKNNETNKMILNQENIDSLYNIIDFCKKKNIRPILVTTPYLHEYTDLINNDFYDDFFVKIQKIQKDTGVEYYDYSNDPRFSQEYTLFANADHLNKNGAKKFVKVLFSETVEE